MMYDFLGLQSDDGSDAYPSRTQRDHERRVLEFISGVTAGDVSKQETLISRIYSKLLSPHEVDRLRVQDVKDKLWQTLKDVFASLNSTQGRPKNEHRPVLQILFTILSAAVASPQNS